MTVNKFLLPILTLIALFGAVQIGKATGFWAVSGKEMIDVGNMTSGDDIRGWMTLEQISNGFDIPQDELYTILNIPAEIAPQTALKDMETIIEGFEVTTVREAVDAYRTGNAAPLPEPAIEATPTPIPTSLPSVTSEHTPQEQGAGDGTGSGPTPLPPGERLPGSEIKGRHTLAEITVQCQVPLDILVTMLELPEDINPNTQTKDLVGQGNVTDVQTVRDAVTQLQR